MRVLNFKQPVWLVLTFLVLISGLILMPLPAFAQDPPPDRPDPPPNRPDAPPDRPDPPTSDPGSPYRGNNGESDRDTPAGFCSTVYGVVTNWGYRNEPTLPVAMDGGSWRMQKTTDDNGYYASDCMGLGIGLVNVIVPPGLDPLTTDVALRLGYKASYELNLGLYSGGIAPSVYLPTMIASKTSVAPGEMLHYSIWVTNTLEAPANGQKWEEVIVTDLLPDELTPLSATSTKGTVEIWDNLVTADIGVLEPGQGAEISITTLVGADVALESTITNRATLIHKGHLVVQTSLSDVVVTLDEPRSPTGSTDNSSSLFDPPNTLPETGAANPRGSQAYLSISPYP